MNPWFKWSLMEEANDPAPAGGGGEPQVPPPASSGSDVDWEMESAPDDDIEGLTVTPAKPAAKTETPPAAPAAATPPVTPPATPPVTPPATPAAETPPATPTPPTTPPIEAASPAEPAAPATPTPDQAALRAKYVTDLTAKYALSDEQARGILVEPEKHLPTLMANLHVDIADQVINTVMRSLPTVVTQLTQQTSEVQKAQQEFFDAWPMLKKPEYMQTVTGAIQAYRQLNPKAPRTEIIRAAGLSALLTLRLPLPRELLNFEPTAPVTPPPGFVPAAPGAGSTPPAAPQPQNPFQLLNQEFDREEQG